MASKQKPPRKGGTYNRFGEDVKRRIGFRTAPGATGPIWGFSLRL